MEDLKGIEAIMGDLYNRYIIYFIYNPIIKENVQGVKQMVYSNCKNVKTLLILFNCVLILYHRHYNYSVISIYYLITFVLCSEHTVNFLN